MLIRDRFFDFYQRVATDHRIGPTHISLYMALAFTSGHDLAVPFYVPRDQVMALAKISSTVTYHRRLRELHEYGYVEYRPSRRKGRTMAMVCRPIGQTQ